MKVNQVLAIGSLANLIVNIVLNHLFMRRWGVTGIAVALQIALSTACVYLFSCAFIMTMAYRRLFQIQGDGVARPTG